MRMTQSAKRLLRRRYKGKGNDSALTESAKQIFCPVSISVMSNSPDTISGNEILLLTKILVCPYWYFENAFALERKRRNAYQIALSCSTSNASQIWAQIS